MTSAHDGIEPRSCFPDASVDPTDARNAGGRLAKKSGQPARFTSRTLIRTGGFFHGDLGYGHELCSAVFQAACFSLIPSMKTRELFAWNITLWLRSHNQPPTAKRSHQGGASRSDARWRGEGR